MNSSFQSARALTVWFTGLSGAGKSTLARAVFESLAAEGRAVELLDGDVVRQALWPDLGFSKADREANIRRLGFLAETLSRHGVIVLVAAIAPFRASRDAVRASLQNFVEVYVNAPVAVCEGRDVKGFYRSARSGAVQHFTGISDPYEPPLSPDVECHTDRESLAESLQLVLAAIRQRFTPA